MDDDVLDSLLCEWAEWMRSDSAACLGYPSRSVEGRMIDDGGLLPRGTACEVREIYMPVSVEIVENALVAMRTANLGHHAGALQVHYLYAYEHVLSRADRLSRLIQIPRMRAERYNERVRLGKAAISGYLIGWFHAPIDSKRLWR